ncbi:hypothetical protein BJ322DRAFT_1068958 [Thelephora terrestris]|uniref:Uncharacterized protein n=1 Tax=Thelephora terrestris TaxID=56493 RepID=A0A9P6HAQ1_9AGAM|nr:hypothetical protein BJ322DRAFT_1068958 [Thelephora terrestris]
MYLHIATTASIQFAEPGEYILSPPRALVSLHFSWLARLVAWIVCAANPHQINPRPRNLYSRFVT